LSFKRKGNPPRTFGFRNITKKEERKYPLEEYLDEWPDHPIEEPCPVCGSQLKEDPIGGFYLKCPKCGWKGW